MQKTFNKYSKWYKVIAIMVGFFWLSAMVFSAFYLATETRHDCSGEDCIICSCVQVCEKIIRQAGGNVAAEIVFVLALSVFFWGALLYKDVVFKMTLVTQKVRLND